ncbi:MAG: polysaccharide deacetylase family protein, partial [bacterium]
MEKIACFTLDLEADYAGMPPHESYESLEQTGAFENLVREHGVKLTTFVTGYILDKNFPILERLKKVGSRFETHTYSHTLRVPLQDKIKDIRDGIDAYKRYFGEMPRGYRAPQGIISRAEVEFIADEGVRYSSSIFPAYLPGRYNNLHLPTSPFIYSGTGLLEIPMSVLPVLRLPITASHLNMLGSRIYRALMTVFGCPGLVNICMHLYDFVDVDAYSNLPLKEKFGYL